MRTHPTNAQTSNPPMTSRATDPVVTFWPPKKLSTISMGTTTRSWTSKMPSTSRTDPGFQLSPVLEHREHDSRAAQADHEPRQDDVAHGPSFIEQREYPGGPDAQHDLQPCAEDGYAPSPDESLDGDLQADEEQPNRSNPTAR